MGRLDGAVRVISASLSLAFAAVGQQVVGIAGAHDAGTGQGQRNAGGVDGDPATAPLFGDIGGGAGAAGGIKDEVAGIGGHEDAALNDLRICLDDINRAHLLKPLLTYPSHIFVIGVLDNRSDSYVTESVSPLS